MKIPFVQSIGRPMIRGLRALKQRIEAKSASVALGEASHSHGKLAENTYHSQHNEDYLLSLIFAKKTTGTAVEVGGFDGITISNTYFFEKLGWRTIIVEPMPASAAKIRQNRQAELFECAAGSATGSATFTIAKGAEDLSTFNPTGYQLKNMEFHGAKFEEIPVSIRTLDDIFTEAKIENLDFITIDVEGHEKEVLAGFNLTQWRPHLVLVEDATMGCGSEIKQMMQKHGYERFMTTGCNDWYAHQSNQQFVHWKSAFLDGSRTLVSRMLALRDQLFSA